MSDPSADVVICGAGIAGISAAYQLTVVHGVKNVAIVDERHPLSLTSDKSTECYRNWWPGPGDAMVRLMNRSIDLLEGWARETDNLIGLNRRGYVFLTADPNRIPAFEAAAEEAARLGAGPVRRHTGAPGEAPYIPAPATGFEGQPDGCDLILDPGLIQKAFPDVNPRAVAAVHPRRCGWFNAHQLGMYLLERARERGARLVRGKVDGVEVTNGRVSAVRVGGAHGTERIVTDSFVIAAGPYLKRTAALMGVDVPVFNELHAKIAFEDHLGVVPRDAGLMIWTDPQRLPWSEDERALLIESEEKRYLLDEFPGGIHARPEGGADSPMLLILWTYDMEPREPVWPPKLDRDHPDVLVRGMAALYPGFESYFERMPKPAYDGGYYCKTLENRPLVGPLPVSGAYVLGALSGFGLMASPAAGELLAAHVTGSLLPDFAPAFSLERYSDPAYLSLLENWGQTGQL